MAAPPIDSVLFYMSSDYMQYLWVSSWEKGLCSLISHKRNMFWNIGAMKFFCEKKDLRVEGNFFKFYFDQIMF